MNRPVHARRLFLTQIDKTFDPQRDIAIGPWCFIGAEEIWPDWHKHDFVDALADPKDFQEADLVSRQLVGQLAEHWGRRLNERHRTNHPPLYWRFILIGWLLTAVQGIWLRYLHVSAFVTRYGDSFLEVELAPVEAPMRPAGLTDFLQHLRRSARFNYWFTSLIVRQIAPEKWALRQRELDDAWLSADGKDQPPAVVSHENPSFAGKIARALLGRLAFNWVPGVGSLKVLFSLYLAALPKRGPGRVVMENYNAGISERFPPAFLAILDGFLEATLPSAYDDGYAALAAETDNEKVYPGRLFVSNFLPSDEKRRLTYARAIALGERFVSIQHGSGYGVHRWNPWSPEIEYPYHAFPTWGWTEHGDHAGNFIPLPSPMLGKVANRHKEELSRLALAATRADIRDVRIIAPRPMAWLQYRDFQKEFIAALGPAPRNNLVYYAYRRDGPDLRDVEYLRDDFPDLKTAEQGLNRDMMSSRLLVIDHLGTAMYFGLAANVPTVCFWNPDAWLIAKHAEPAFAGLRACGMLHDDPASAAAHINAIWDDVAGWWSSPAVQAARQAWLGENGRTSRIWWWHWLKALTGLQLSGRRQINSVRDVAEVGNGDLRQDLRS